MLKGFKTKLLSFVAGLVAVASMPQFHAIVPPDWLPYILFAVAVIGWINRNYTDGPSRGKF